MKKELKQQGAANLEPIVTSIAQEQTAQTDKAYIKKLKRHARNLKKQWKRASKKLEKLKKAFQKAKKKQKDTATELAVQVADCKSERKELRQAFKTAKEAIRALKNAA
jgi:predicted  nucleic acid-binding Zn-ribbon protein